MDLNKTVWKFKGDGFTLIELLVVVLIIGVLAAIALPKYQRAVNKADMTEALVLVHAAVSAQQRYKLATGQYSNTWDSLDLSFPAKSETSEYESGTRYYTVIISNKLELMIENSWIAGLKRKTSQRRMFVAVDVSNPAVSYCCFDSGNEEAQETCASLTSDTSISSQALWGRVCYVIK